MQPTARSVPVDELARSRLGPLGRPLGSGGQATVYEVPALRLPDVGGPLVYKEYKAGQAPPGGLATVVALRNRLDPARRNRLDQITAWPSRIVTEHGAVRGVVMPRIPDGFLQDMLLPGTGAHKINPREVQNLFIPPERAQRLGMPVPTPEQRLAVCRDFAAAVAFLHDELNVVFGDVNAKNELFRLDAEPMVMFVDCDAVRKAGHIAVVQQLNAPDWEPAEGSVLTKSTDRYKLGLFILRCLTPGLGCSVNRDPSRAAPVLDAAGMGLLTRALQGAAPHDRPTAAQWWRHLCRMLGQPADQPVLHRVGTDRTIVSAGTPVLVHWVADDARTVEVAAPGCPVVRVDVQGRSGSVPVYPARAGMLQVWVRNSFGADQATIGPVAVVDLPTTSTLPVPLPRCPLPDLRALALPGIAPVPLPAALSSAQHWPLPADMLGPSTEPPGGAATRPAGAAPRRGVPMNVRDRLARLAGAQLDLLRAAPGDYDKHTAMGGVLLSTAAVAGVSATFALYTAVGLSVLASVLAGLIWAVIILNLDRMLVVSMTRQTGLWLNLATAVPRILLAIIIGAVISTPLVLRIFQPEIDNELQVLHAENLIAGQQKLDEQFADIRPMQDRVDQLQAIAAGQIQPGVNTDPDVQAAQAAVDTAQTAYDQAARNAQCELDGSCGTGTAGEGEAWRRAQALADQALGTLTAAKAKLAQTEAVARERISGSVASNQQAAEQELTTLRPALRQRLDDRAAAQQRLDRGEANNSGLLARLEALDRLSAERPVTRTANIALFLLFLFIEILPVLVKLLIGIGKPTLYEKIAQRREKDANRADLIWSRKQKAIASVRSNVRYRLEKDRATAQIDAGKVMNAELVARQTAIAEQAIDVWGKVAAARSDEALRRWYAQHSAGNGLPVLPQPTQTQPTQTSPIQTQPTQTRGHQPGAHQPPSP